MSGDLPADDSDSGDVVEVPIDGVLDLHQFRPGDAREVVSDYLDACRGNGVLDVRIIHGKGKGVLRRIVHSLLEDRADVVKFRLASDSGSWGATLVRLADRAELERLASATDRSGGGSLPRYVVAAAVLALGIVAMGCGAAVEQGAEADAAAADYQADPGDEDAIIWYGRRLAYLSRYNDAIEVYSRGLVR